MTATLVEPVQLTLDGREDPLGPRVRLGSVQELVLERLRVRPLTSTEVGSQIHGFGLGCPAGSEPSGTGDYAGAGCCDRASTDGSHACRRLARRGLVVKYFGLWFRSHDS